VFLWLLRTDGKWLMRENWMEGNLSYSYLNWSVRNALATFIFLYKHTHEECLQGQDSPEVMCLEF